MADVGRGQRSVLPGGERFDLIDVRADNDSITIRKQGVLRMLSAKPGRVIYAGFDGGDSAITTHVPMYFRVTWNGSITAWTLISDAVGSVQIDVWKAPFASIPTVANTITNGEPPSLSSQRQRRVLAPRWEPGFVEGDVFGFNLDSAATIKWCILELETAFV